MKKTNRNNSKKANGSTVNSINGSNSDIDFAIEIVINDENKKSAIKAIVITIRSKVKNTKRALFTSVILPIILAILSLFGSYYFSHTNHTTDNMPQSIVKTEQSATE